MTFEELVSAKARGLTVSIKLTGAAGKVNGIGRERSYIDFFDTFTNSRHLLEFPNAEFQLEKEQSNA